MRVRARKVYGNRGVDHVVFTDSAGSVLAKTVTIGRDPMYSTTFTDKASGLGEFFSYSIAGKLGAIDRVRAGIEQVTGCKVSFRSTKHIHPRMEEPSYAV